VHFEVIFIHIAHFKLLFSFRGIYLINKNLMSDISSDEEMFLLYHINNITKKRKRNRKMWVREVFLHREQLGEFHHYVPQLRNDFIRFQNYYRTSENCNRMLLKKVSKCINIGHTNYRKTISIDERLIVTMRYE
jgi:hypothetical protein